MRTLGVGAFFFFLSIGATPANKAGLQRHYGPFLGKNLDRCTTCHLPNANKAPESLDEFPHNLFGDRLRSLGKNKDIRVRLKMIAREDADGDGVNNETELLLGHNPGDPKDRPLREELAGVGGRAKEYARFVASYQWEPFNRVTQPAVPHAKNRNWIRNPIDAFVAAEHQSHGLKPRPAAPKEILLRRVYLDLIGLSPSPAEIAAFEADGSADAYEKVVDRLLADSRYGERWARHWMDVWRYSDWAGWSGGNQIRDSKPHIWRWRDWIIESLNQDKGYDKMVLEMLAADEAAPGDTNALRATGFLVRNYKMLSREQWLEDTVKHTSQAFLGLTVGCAKCHNHMYDPVSQKEYYQFRAIFEPHQVRTDRIPGQTDPAKDGLVRVYDVGTNSPTYFFVRGDERKADTNRVMTPGVPRILGGKYEIEPIHLPRSSAFPDNRPFVISDLSAESDLNLKAAREKLAAVKANASSDPEKLKEEELSFRIAQSKHDSLLAVIKVEQLEASGKKSQTEWTEAAQAAAQAQRILARDEAKLNLARMETADRAAAAKLEKSANEEAARKGVETSKKNRLESESKLAAAEKLVNSEPTTSFTPRPVEIYPETSTGRRLALGHWIANRNNPLTARVAMNHIWLRHFSQGIVPTPADFGQNGKPATNPALLDWLAAELMNRGWSMKTMHRLIVTSSTYRMSSTTDLADSKIDPDNNFLWRMPSKRMEGELVRDNLLYVASDLDSRMGGPEIDQNQGLTSKRRSVYLRTAAEKEVEFLKIFDGPSVTECYMRHPSVVPQQALALANSELALAEAGRVAAKLSAEAPAQEDFVHKAFLRVLARDPKPEETKVCSEFLTSEEKKHPASRARQNLMLVLFNHNDFVTVR
jgi:hypothetical protein